MMQDYSYFDRDISWLGFNRRVLEEAANCTVPLIERIRFLSIHSSNLDEFYRVRIPVLRALKEIESGITQGDGSRDVLQQVNGMVVDQQQRFGQILTTELLPQLKANDVWLFYNETMPAEFGALVTEYFLNEVLAFLQPVSLKRGSAFFPENNKLYFVIRLREDADTELMVLLNIPSDDLPRFFSAKINQKQYICFLDDVIRINLDKLFAGRLIVDCYSIKITRDAELDLKDEYPGELSDQIEQQLNKRDQGIATRFLYPPDMPLRLLQLLAQVLSLQNATHVQGGRYHNLKDLNNLPVNIPSLLYDKWPAASPRISASEPLISVIAKEDLLINTPYQSYQTILRFFNEAANNPDVLEINVTLYRVASDSRIVNALISAAKNGRQVKVVVELKARFDEANNLKWAKKMKAAGVQIIYSVTALKIHAKVALVKYRNGNRITYSGLLATGNFNEGTARFYTDHILLTANHNLLREVELLFLFLARREKPSAKNKICFEHLLVAGFNLQDRFLELIDREIRNAKQGLPANIIIKMNNLEERGIINKLYQASQAGVKVSLIIRGICCLIPGVAGMSDNVTVRRIVDRYLEHGRAFIFENNGSKDMYLGSADWMSRNIYRRIEVCFPVYDHAIKKQLQQLVDDQLNDNVQAVLIDQDMAQLPVREGSRPVQSQKAIYIYLNNLSAIQPQSA
jgi:polyphosphate kinase